MFADTDHGGGTDWSMQSVPQMWSMLQNQDGTAHKDLLVTWKKSADLLVDHLSRVKNYRDNLAEAWPPEKSAASAKYLDRLDDLIKHLSDTYHASVQNHHALGAATSALVLARKKLAAIYQEYMANQQELDAYALKKQAPTQPLSKWRAITISPPPATESRQLELQLQAQSVMSTLSTDLAEAQLNLATPKLYNPQNRLQDSEPFKPKGPDAASAEPSKTGRELGLIKTSGGNSPSGFNPIDARTASSNIQPSTALQGSEQGWRYSEHPSLRHTAPIFSGISPSTGAMTPQTSTAIPAGKISDTENNHDISAIAGSIPPPSRLAGSRTDSDVRSNPGGVIPRETGSAVPGKIIGHLPAESNSQQPAAGPSRMQKVNPPGGIIGPLGSPRNPSRQQRPEKSGSDESRNKDWDLDNPWLTAEGVAPVILPPEKQKIDPGPVIGLS
ncbi:hypothetical protein ACTOB_008059 [Actinoplanes oblitus]|uniref:PPE family domain-containing protein n=1 Tax=Actinoplanes oblitus TaxID=3040509 RepID=A0ABY8WE32_9ACTN|nr:hypothetical protein [Actinoplanes oblitus]WIM95918.1 hypothetical protein ACTOB_008059 [Actinoplanes oblitus]